MKNPKAALSAHFISLFLASICSGPIVGGPVFFGGACITTFCWTLMILGD